MKERDRMKKNMIEALMKELKIGLESLDKGEYSQKTVNDIAEDVLYMYQK